MWTSGAQHAYHPVSLRIKLSLHHTLKAVLRQIECSVEARWEAITRFSLITESNNDSIASRNDSPLAMSKTVLLKRQATKLLFPPWYQIALEDSK
jgi:hypothetical protein